MSRNYQAGLLGLVFSLFMIPGLSGQSSKAVEQYLSNYFSLLNNLGDASFAIEEKELFKESIALGYFYPAKTLIANNLNADGSKFLKGEEYLESIMVNYPSGIEFKFQDIQFGRLRRDKKMLINFNQDIRTAGRLISNNRYTAILKVESLTKESISGKILSIDLTSQEIVSEEKLWKSVVNTNTLQAYRAYLKNYPEGIFKKPAENKITQLSDDYKFLYQEIVELKDEERMKVFIQDFPQTKEAEEGRKKLADWLSQKSVVHPLIQEINNNMVKVGPGDFMFGCNDEYDDCQKDEQPFQLRKMEGFWIGKYEVTQALFIQVMEYNPSYYDDISMVAPVENVSWTEANAFLAKLNSLPSNPYTYRLPTEEEWEYAAGGGEDEIYSGGSNIRKVAVYSANNNDGTEVVGTKQPNKYGIYDMSGNVSEWCSNNYTSSLLQSIPNDPGLMVHRGGNWSNKEKKCRINRRGKAEKEYKHETIGFRLVRNF